MNRRIKNLEDHTCIYRDLWQVETIDPEWMSKAFDELCMFGEVSILDNAHILSK